MSVWREVQEALYGAWNAGWAATTPCAFANEKLDLPEPAPAHARVRVQSMPSAQETLGTPGNRKIARKGAVYVILREPPLAGVGGNSDLGEKARAIFEGQRFAPHAIRFAACQIAAEGEIDGGRWWGSTIECPFDYEEIK